MGMDTMLADMASKLIEKHIPPEVQAWLTKENIERVGNEFNKFIADVRADMAEIKSQNAQILAFVEALENERRDSANRGGRSRSGNRGSGGKSG
jgi:hypothetical protein